MDKIELSNWLNDFLYRTGRTQKWLSDRSGISTGQISRILNATSEPTMNTLQKIARVVYPRDEFYQAAGIRKDGAKEDPLTTLARAEFSQLNGDNREKVATYIRFLLEQQDKGGSQRELNNGVSVRGLDKAQSQE